MLLGYTIKTFNNLTTTEKSNLFEMIKDLDFSAYNNFEEMQTTYISSNFNYGDNVFVIFNNSHPLGVTCVITKEIAESSKAYLTDMFLNLNSSKSLSFKLQLFYSLLNHCIIFCKKFNASNIELDLRQSQNKLSPLIKSGGFQYKCSDFSENNSHPLYFKRSI